MYRYFRYIGVKILNNISVKRSQQYIKTIIYRDHVGFVPGISVICHMEKLKKANPRILLTDVETVI